MKIVQFLLEAKDQTSDKTTGLEILWFILLGNKLHISIGRQHLLLALVECETLNVKKDIIIYGKGILVLYML